MMRILPNRLFLTHGVGVHRERLHSFEWALRDAGLGRYNLVCVSSILPPGCLIVPRAEGESGLLPGQILHVVLARKESNEPHRMLAASVGLAVPSDPNQYGYLSEHESFGETAKEAGDYAEDLAAAMLASTLGVDFDEQQSWDEQREAWNISGKIVTTRNVTQSAVVKPDRRWTTVIAAAALLCD